MTTVDAVGAGLQFDAATHRYLLEGVLTPSVTQVLGASGLVDFSMIPASIREAALSRGTTVHQAIHFYNEQDLDLGEFMGGYPTCAPFVQAWVSFCEERHPTAWLCEHRLASRRHGYAGTIDYLGELAGEGVLLDFATGDPDDVAKNLQTAAYLGAAMEWQHEPGQDTLRRFFQTFPYVKRYAVQLTKAGTFRLTRYDRPTDFSEFLALMAARRVVEKYRGEWTAWLEGTAA